MSVSFAIALVNSDGVNSVVRGVANALTLTITNIGDAVNLVGGVPAPNSGVFGIVLNFAAFYTDASSARNISISAPGFTLQYDESNSVWGMSLDTSVTGWQGTFTISMSNITPDKDDDTASLQLVFVNAPSNMRHDPKLQPYTTVPVPINAPPSATLSNQLPLTFSFSPPTGTPGLDNQVFISKTPDDLIANGLVLTLANTGAGALVSSAVSTGSNSPRFTLSFVCSSEPPGTSALTTAEKLNNIIVSAEDGANWNVRLQTDSDLPTVLITPTPTNTAILEGMNGRSLASFDLTNLITQMGAGSTMAYLQYTDIPGYNDGVIGIVLRKVYQPLAITDFHGDQNYGVAYSVTGLGATTGYLAWNTEGAVMAQLECLPPVAPLANAPYGQVPLRTNSYPVLIQENQTFVLTAYDPWTRTMVSATVPVTITPPLSHQWVPSHAVLPWRGSPSNVPSGFVLCDGQNGTPDLRNRFVKGAVPNDVNTSGSDTHTHDLTVSIVCDSFDSVTDSHRHEMPEEWTSQNFDDSDQINTINAGAGVSGATTGATDPNSHTHTLAPYPPILDTTQQNTCIPGSYPNYYTLCFIMKT